MTARLSAWLRVDAHRFAVETAGAAFLIERRGAAEAGAVAVKLVRTGGGFGAPSEARALVEATLGDGARGWSWLVGPDWAPEPEVDARLARQAAFDPDLWITTVEDRDGRHFLTDPVAP